MTTGKSCTFILSPKNFSRGPDSNSHPHPQNVLVARLVHRTLHREYHFLQLQCENIQSAIQIIRTLIYSSFKPINSEC